jgi:DNA-3-methyladenine glycosylase I
MITNELNRCPWPGKNELAKEYHDKEWGVPLHTDQKHYEFLLLDGFQAGLSWNTILNKRIHFQKAFDNFDYMKICSYDSKKTKELMENTGIIRNKLKIEASISNAKAFISVCEKHGSFDSYIWQFVEGKTIINHFKTIQEVPAKTAISDKMSKELSNLGFKFVGSTICYAYMQAAGMVNDHLTDCFRHKQLR